MTLTALTALLAIGAPQNANLQPATTIADGPEPARIDVSHSTLSFAVRHFGVTKIRGQFNDWSGTIWWNGSDLTKSTVAVAIKTASVDTRHTRRDADLVGDNFFDAEQFPAILLRSTNIVPDGDNYIMHAQLTVRDITRQVEIPFEFLGVQEIRGTRIFAAGSFAINRSDYDLARENRLARSLGAVSDKVEFELDIQAVLDDAAGASFNSRGKPSIGEELAKVMEANGTNAALERYRAIKTSNPDDYNMSDRELQLLVNRLLASAGPNAALELSAALADEAPSADWHVIRARAHLALNDRQAAAREIRRAIELDAHHTRALAMVPILETSSPDR